MKMTWLAKATMPPLLHWKTLDSLVEILTLQTRTAGYLSAKSRDQICYPTVSSCRPERTSMYSSGPICRLGPRLLRMAMRTRITGSSSRRHLKSVVAPTMGTWRKICGSGSKLVGTRRMSLVVEGLTTIQTKTDAWSMVFPMDSGKAITSGPPKPFGTTPIFPQHLMIATIYTSLDSGLPPFHPSHGSGLKMSVCWIHSARHFVHPCAGWGGEETRDPVLGENCCVRHQSTQIKFDFVLPVAWQRTMAFRPTP
mmetsp:Transcript_1886/g.3990  ORF Transcript_1886/g.3990 Transcript_1886/m.3990 type:complete len:253 (-) Transcript_1886:794-1552(-)